MGIDKADIRRVIHYGPTQVIKYLYDACFPKYFSFSLAHVFSTHSLQTLEQYVQEIGRAGRDGLISFCSFFANVFDFQKFNSNLNKN